MTRYSPKPAFAGTHGRYRLASIVVVLTGLIGFGGTWVRGAQDNKPRESRYALTVVAKTGDVIDGKRIHSLSGASINNQGINNQGTIAFSAFFEDGQSSLRQGIFTTESGLVVQAGDVIDGRTLINHSLSVPYGINDEGTIVFAAFSSDAQGHSSRGFFTQSESVVQVGDTIGGKTLSRFCATAVINNSGTVAFFGQFPREGGFGLDEGLFTQHDLLVRVGDTIGGKTLSTFNCEGFVPPTPSMNNLGTITFQAFFSTAPGHGIFTTQGNLVAQPGDTIAGKTVQSVFGPRINDDGTIAFTAGFDDTHGIVTPSGFLIEQGDKIDDQTFNGLTTNGFRGFNNRGTALFVASFNPEGREGLATQSDLVVLAGDTIDGRRVGVPLIWSGINDRGMIVFTIGLQNPDTGVFDASALVLAVPQPE